MQVEALETLSADGVDAENHLVVLQMVAANFTAERAGLAKDLIAKFQVPDQLVVALFGRAAVPALLDELTLRKNLKLRQDSLYRQHKYQYTFAQSLGFVELFGLLNIKAAWPEFERVIGQYSLDSEVVLGQLVEVLSRCEDYDWFGQVLEQSPFTHQQLLSSIHWRLGNLEDWNPTLRAAAGLVGKRLEFDDVYRMLGSDEEFQREFDLDWEQQLMEQSGTSQFSALMLSGPLDGEPTAGQSKQIPTVRQRPAFAAFLAELGHKEPVLRMCRKFPLIVQANEQLAAYINKLLLEDLDNRELLQLAGPSIGRSHDLMVALAAKFREYEQFRVWMLPAISLADARTVEVLWSVLETFSLDERYTLYTEWQFSVPRYHKGVKFALKAAEKKTQSILKRISNENVDEMLGQFCKVAEANPYSVFSVFMSQVESYDKIGRLILKDPKFNRLGWDVLPLVILVQLSSGRAQQGDSGLLHSKWVQALSRFTAHLAVGNAEFNVAKLLEFVLKQFHQNKFDNLVLLRELLLYMGGSIDMYDLSMDNIRALGASKPVQEQTRRQLFADMPGSETIGRLLGALKSEALVLEFFLALVYAKRYRLHEAGLAPPKVLGHIYDESQDVLQRYTALLALLEPAEFESFVPAVPVLVDQFGVPLEDALSVWRPFLAEQTRKSDSNDLQQLATVLPAQSPRFSNALYVAGWTLEPYDLVGPSGGERGDSGRLAAQKHTLMVKKCQNRLSAEQATWFHAPEGTRHSQMLEFLTKIVLPRALYSRIDAVFCVNFLFLVNRIGAVHFSTLSCLKSLMSGHLLYNTLVGSTAEEAECLGLFLYELFRRLINAASKSDVFDRFQDQHTQDGVTSWTAAQLKQRDENPGSREQVRERLFSRRELYTAVSLWAKKMLQMVVDALGKDDFCTVRNAISVLKHSLSQLFKTTSGQKAHVSSALEALMEDHRADIKLAATAISVQVKGVQEGSVVYRESRPRERRAEGAGERGRSGEGSERSGQGEGSDRQSEPSTPDVRDRSHNRSERGDRERNGRNDRERGERGERGDRPDRRERERAGAERDRERGERSVEERLSRDSLPLSAKPELDPSNSLPSRPTRPPSPSRDDWLAKRERQKQENAERRDRLSDRGDSDRGERTGDRTGDRRRSYFRPSGGRRGEYRDRATDRATDRDRTPLPPPPRDTKRSRLD